MMRLRPYKPSDAKRLLSWWAEVPEEIFVMWSNGKFEYPLTMEQLEFYFQTWCVDEENGWLMTALDENGDPVGHFIMRLADYEAESIRLGFIIVDPNARGKGYGKEMIRLALKYAFEVLGMKRATLGVFENNPSAKACYEAVGFTAKEYVADYLAYKGTTHAAYEMEAVNHG